MIKWSHSKLTCMLKNPAEYYLSYVLGITPKEEKSALALGSAVHWGIENNTSDLSEYYKEKGSFKQKDNYTKDQLLAESMVYGYLKHKDELFEQILKDNDGNKLELLEETHEVFLTGYLKSKFEEIDKHEFIGIIDLLLLTNKGFILIDYKTSSQVPDWDKYLDQLYRYIFLLEQNFPDIPVVKIAIINLRKSMIRPKKNENDEEFLKRLKFEYELNDENYINYHEFLPETLDKTLIKDYVDSLSTMCDNGYLIDKYKLYYTNFSDASNGSYGKSQFYDIFYKTPDAFALYNIEDKVYDENANSFLTKRDCTQFDINNLFNEKCINKYEKYKNIYNNYKEIHSDTSNFIKFLKENYKTDDNLLRLYSQTYEKDK